MRDARFLSDLGAGRSADVGSVTEEVVRFLQWLLPMLAACVQTPLCEPRSEPLRTPRPSLKTAFGTYPADRRPL